MKTMICNFPVLAICTIALTFSAHAQFPTFTPVDTGAIVDLSIGHENLSAHMFDVDNDGDIDPVIGYSSGDNNGYPAPLNLYRNEGNGVFVPSVFLPETSNAFPVKFTSPAGDIDNDGDIDVIGQKKFDTELGVYFNDGHGNFTSDTMFNLTNTFDSFYPVLLDFNKDGFLDIIRFAFDIYVAYNNGSGKFLERENIGQYGMNAWILHSMSLADADNDGDMDAYTGHSIDTERNFFFINTGDSFEQTGADHITLSDTTTTVCVNWIDYDNDDDMDLYVHNYTFDTIDGPLPALYENLGNLEFEKHIIYPEKYRGVYSNSSNWADLDNDGDLDLFLPVENNPHFMNGAPPIYPYNILLLNDGDGGFTEVTDNALTQNGCHTAEIFDFDNDGDLDVLTIGNAWVNNGHNQLFVNEGNSNSSILLNFKDRYGCVTPFGTRIYAKTEIFSKRVLQTREVTPVDGNLSFGNIRMHFGLGDAEVVDTLVIRWPSGHVDEHYGLTADEIYYAVEDEGIYISRVGTKQVAKDMKIWPNPFNTSTTLSFEMEQPGTVQIMIFNQFGQQVGIIEQQQAVGRQEVTWNAGDLAPGVYYCVLKTEKRMQTVKLIKL